MVKIILEHLKKIILHYLVILDGHKIVPSVPFQQSALKITMNDKVRSKSDDWHVGITFSL